MKLRTLLAVAAGLSLLAGAAAVWRHAASGLTLAGADAEVIRAWPELPADALADLPSSATLVYRGTWWTKGDGEHRVRVRSSAPMRLRIDGRDVLDRADPRGAAAAAALPLSPGAHPV